MNYIVNSFSLNMIDSSKYPAFTVRVMRISQKYAKELYHELQPTSGIGHGDLAEILSVDLDANIEANRINISIEPGDRVLVAQYVGPRMPEGSTQLLKDADIYYFYVFLEAG